jgi:hypothetical protein
MQELHQLVNVAGADKAFNLRKVQGEIMIAQPMPDTSSSQRDLVMRLGQLLGVLVPLINGSHQVWLRPVWSRCKITCASRGSFLSHELFIASRVRASASVEISRS